MLLPQVDGNRPHPSLPHPLTKTSYFQLRKTLEGGGKVKGSSVLAAKSFKQKNLKFAYRDHKFLSKHALVASPRSLQNSSWSPHRTWRAEKTRHHSSP